MNIALFEGCIVNASVISANSCERPKVWTVNAMFANLMVFSRCYPVWAHPHAKDQLNNIMNLELRYERGKMLGIQIFLVDGLASTCTS